MKKKETEVDPRNRGLNCHVTFTLTEDDRAWLDEQVRESEAPIGAVMRKAFKMYREAQEKKQR